MKVKFLLVLVFSLNISLFAHEEESKSTPSIGIFNEQMLAGLADLLGYLHEKYSAEIASIATCIQQEQPELIDMLLNEASKEIEKLQQDELEEKEVEKLQKDEVEKNLLMPSESNLQSNLFYTPLSQQSAVVRQEHTLDEWIQSIKNN